MTYIQQFRRAGRRDDVAYKHYVSDCTFFFFSTARNLRDQPFTYPTSGVFSQLFGEDEDGGELDEAEKQGENGQWNTSLWRRLVIETISHPGCSTRNCYLEKGGAGV